MLNCKFRLFRCKMSHFHYLPLTPGFFSIRRHFSWFLLVVLLVLRALRQAYVSLGVSSSTAMLLLFGSLIGSYFNIPVAVSAARTRRVGPGHRVFRHAI